MISDKAWPDIIWMISNMKTVNYVGALCPRTMISSPLSAKMVSITVTSSPKRESLTLFLKWVSLPIYYINSNRPIDSVTSNSNDTNHLLKFGDLVLLYSWSFYYNRSDSVCTKSAGRTISTSSTRTLLHLKMKWWRQGRALIPARALCILQTVFTVPTEFVIILWKG